MTGTTMRGSRLRHTSIAVVLTAGLALSACGGDDTAAPPDDTGSDPKPTATPDRPSQNEEVTGWLLALDDGRTISVDPVRFLSGQEAHDAAVEDGEISEDEELPNDFYIDDIAPDEATYDLDEEATVQLYDCSGGCELVDVALHDFVDGSVIPYGGEHALIDLVVEDGVVVAITEQYVP